MKDQHLKIIQLEAQNIKRLKAIRIRPDGNMIVIGGNNGQGKTSVLDSIMYALGGKSAVCDEPIHKGETRAEIVIDLGEFIVTRTFTEKGGSLTIKNADGVKQGSPQALLDSLAGRLSFDPLDFARMDTGKQAATLREMVGLDFTELDYERKQTFDKRTDINRGLKAAKAKLEDAPLHPDAPVEEVSVADLSAELAKAQEAEVEFERKKAEWIGAKEAVAQIERVAERVTEELAVARRDIINYTAKAQAAKEAAKAVPDLKAEGIRSRLDAAEDLNAHYRANKVYEALGDDCDKLSSQSAELTKTLARQDKEKQTALAKAKFPVKGLSFNEDGVTLNDLPFEQASAAEQLRISIAMGIALNPKLRVMLIRDGSLLDEKSLAMVAEMAAESDSQVWIERVGDGAEVSVVLEDGEIRAEKPKAAKATKPAGAAKKSQQRELIE